ncbi:hypothetical protein L9F63_011570, partial [Diploptera punctata]
HLHVQSQSENRCSDHPRFSENSSEINFCQHNSKAANKCYFVCRMQNNSLSLLCPSRDVLFYAYRQYDCSDSNIFRLNILMSAVLNLKPRSQIKGYQFIS